MVVVTVVLEFFQVKFMGKDTWEVEQKARVDEILRMSSLGKESKSRGWVI